MKEFLFNTEMIIALRAGRKTQTRHPMIPQLETGNIRWDTEKQMKTYGGYPLGRGGIQSPYGEVGAIKNIRERHAYIMDAQYGGEDHIEYYADTLAPYPAEWEEENAKGNPDAPKWRPSIYMTKDAIRTRIEITNVRFEPLHSISYADIVAEGIKQENHNSLTANTDDWLLIDKFISLWDGIYAKRGFSWFNNPWVWVHEFKLLDAFDKNS